VENWLAADGVVEEKRVTSELEEKEEVFEEVSPYYGMEKFSAAMDIVDQKFGVIKADMEFENHVVAAKKCLPSKTGKPRAKALFEEYLGAMEHEATGETTTSTSKYTRRMFQDLIEMPERNHGRGPMILLRIPPSVEEKDDGVDLATQTDLVEQLRAARDRLGLKHRFAILADLDMKKTKKKFELKDHMEKQEHKDLHTHWMAGIENRCGRDEHGNVNMPKQLTYEDLLDLPCILILCEKGKMGDTFPKSLRFYDLRLRYNSDTIIRSSMEQDLGRGFCYRAVNDGYPPPLILASKVLENKLKTGTGGRLAFLRLQPDKKLKPVTKVQNFKCPTREGDLEPYRKVPVTNDHFDHHWSPDTPCTDLNRTCAGQNPRRFLLFGRPQIGKTGAFLHLSYCLWVRLGKPRFKTEFPLEVVPPDPDHDPADDGPDPPGDAVAGLYPDTDWLKNCDWSCRFGGHKWESEPKKKNGGPPGTGKYGDPACKELYDYAVCAHHPDREQGIFVHPNADELGRGTTAKHKPAPVALAAARNADNVSGEAASSKLEHTDEAHARPSDHAAAGAAVPGGPLERARYFARNALDPRYWHIRARVAEPEMIPPNEGEAAYTARVQKMDWDSRIRARNDICFEPGCGGKLHIPVSQQWLWKIENNVVKGLWELTELDCDCVQYPIFTPSAGRADEARLDIHDMLEGNPYLQIIAVKPRDLKEYQAYWPTHIFFELPAEADTLGIGYSRHYIKKLAEQIVDPDFYYCLVLDDSVYRWNGVTLANDPFTPCGIEPTNEAQTIEISMWKMLRHFEAVQFDSIRGDFGIIGFYKGEPYKSKYSKHSFLRRHPTSAVILNLEKLKGYEYQKELHMLEDMDFNNRLVFGKEAFGSEKQATKDMQMEEQILAIKSMRFVQYKWPKFKKGGCNYMHARPCEAEPPPPPPAPPSPVPNEETLEDFFQQLVKEDLIDASDMLDAMKVVKANVRGESMKGLQDFCEEKSQGGENDMFLTNLGIKGYVASKICLQLKSCKREREGAGASSDPKRTKLSQPGGTGKKAKH